MVMSGKSRTAFRQDWIIRHWSFTCQFICYRSRQFLSATDKEALDAAFELARLEGIIPALESAHALAAFK